LKVENDKYKCHFCGSLNVKIPTIHILLAMGGTHYSFCSECLLGMTADEFWESFFISLGYSYPPKLEKWAQKAWDKGITFDDARYPKSNPSISSPQKKLSKKPYKTRLERQKITNALRYKIMRRDGFQCILCGATGKESQLQVDHIVPISKGGKTKIENLRTLCKKCNSGKGNKSDNDKSL